MVTDSMDLDAAQERKVRSYLARFNDWTAADSADERFVKARNLAPPVYLAFIGSNMIHDNMLISTLVRGGANVPDPFIGELETTFLTLYGHELRVDLDLASSIRTEQNEQQWIQRGLRDLEISEACALVYSVNDRDTFKNLQDLMARYVVDRKPDWACKQLFLVASQIQVPEADWAVSAAEGAGFSNSIGCSLLRMSVHTGEGTSQLVLKAMAALVLLRRSQSDQVQEPGRSSNQEEKQVEEQESAKRRNLLARFNHIFASHRSRR